ncbi:hypothetical protein ACIHCX_14495 [Streptomyces sp. NPDC052043]|uniref:hypothetical protein n=1 Tax=Streptomyces sp. NPDC052043 TaxID=3365684 RepID=UPI0037D28B1E
MFPDAVAPGSVRSAAELNEQIRSLWLRSGGSLSAQERAAYEVLVVEWATAMRDELIAAA